MRILESVSVASACLLFPLAAGAQTSTVNFGTTYQTIRGFGASTAWTAQEAVARGAIEFATPWTPPAYMKTNGSTVGGSLSTGSYAAFASARLATCRRLPFHPAVSA